MGRIFNSCLLGNSTRNSHWSPHNVPFWWHPNLLLYGNRIESSHPASNDIAWLSFNSKTIFPEPYSCPLVPLHTISSFFFPLGCMLEGRVWYWMMSNPFLFIEGQTHLAPLGMPKWIRPSMDQYSMFFVQTSTLPPSMHRKLTKHGRVVWKTTNSWPKVMLS
jgi:hypothetical protein